MERGEEVCCRGSSGRISAKICSCSLVSWIKLNEGKEGFWAIDKIRLTLSLRRR